MQPQKVPADSPPAEDSIARSSPNPLPGMTPPAARPRSSLLLTRDDHGPSDQSLSHKEDFHFSFLAGSTAVSSSATSGTYLCSMCEYNTMSQSTTATSPDMRVPKEQPSFSDLSALADDADDGESKILEKTYAYEPLHNKEGQITGGTLPAPVERLTKYENYTE
ncbi:hypothetical protein B0O99DRAFT_718270 [Bisporella sp. PMI_857]|nr:hypothetical protein B0O99DRAFT_718270 [Bisporella sp. PMI_857]